MPGHLDSTAFGVRYLLGELSEQEEESFEKRYFADDRAFEELQIAEAEVIDTYVRDELSANARQHLEQRLAKSPRLRERVAFARTFARSISNTPSHTMSVESATLPTPAVYAAPQSRWWKGLVKDSFARQPSLTLALAVCLALVLLGGAAVIFQSVRLRNESQRLETERAAIARQREELNRLSAEQREKIDQIASALKDEQSRNDRAQELLKELQQRQKAGESVAPQKGGPTLASLILLPGSLRSEGASKELIISPGTSAVQLQLVLQAADYRKYRVIVKNSQAVEIRQKNALKPQRSSSGSTLSLQLPARLLPPGDYIVNVSGVAASGAVESVSDYVFHVSTRQ